MPLSEVEEVEIALAHREGQSMIHWAGDMGADAVCGMTRGYVLSSLARQRIHFFFTWKGNMSRVNCPVCNRFLDGAVVAGR